MKYIALIVAAVGLVACSETPRKAEQQKKTPEKPLEPVTGRQAYQQMYVSARAWAPDAQPIHLRSLQLSSVTAAPGKAGAWQCIFVSPSRRRAKTYSWSAVEAEGNLHKGVFAGGEESYSPSGQQQPFLTAAIRTDSDEAYRIAEKKSQDFLKKSPKMPVNFILEYTPRYPNPAWRVLWGETVGTSPYSIFVDATNGAFLGRVH